VNIIVLAIKPMQPEDTQFPVRVEFSWGAADDLLGNSVITVEVWLNKEDVGDAPLSAVHEMAIQGAYKLLERAVDAAPSADIVTGF
jgi:hypothetical protein